MKTQLNRAHGHTNRAVAPKTAQQKRPPQPASQVANGSPGAIAQRKLQALASSGPLAQKRGTYQQLANQSQPVQRATYAGQRPRKASASQKIVAQRITHNGATVDIATLDLANAQPHLARLRRVRGKLNAGQVVLADDAPYSYGFTDEADLQTHIQALKTAELTTRHTALRASLTSELAALATSADWEPGRPAWMGSGIKGHESSEVVGANVVATLDAVRGQWQSFLGPGSFSQKHPCTGATDLTRLVSADGQRSIRYGNHERNSAPNKHHFHQETWTHQPGLNTVTVANVLRRVPIS